MDVTQIMKTIMAMEQCSPHEHEIDERQRWDELYDGLDFYDDVHQGHGLDKNMVMAARKLDIDFVTKMGGIRERA